MGQTLQGEAPEILAFCNQKGGVAKSTVAVHAAYYAVEKLGLRVVLADLDTQRNATSCFQDSEVLMDASELFETCPDDWTGPKWQGGAGVKLIPADRPLSLVEEKLAEVMTGNVGILHNAKTWLRRLDCDLIIIDTPPQAEVRLRSALVAANCVVTPFTMQSFSLDGIAGLYDTIQTIQSKHNPALRYLGILPAKINSRSGSQQRAYDELRETLGNLVIDAPIKERAPISDAMDNRRPVWHRPNGQSAKAAAEEMLAACTAIFERVKA